MKIRRRNSTAGLPGLVFAALLLSACGSETTAPDPPPPPLQIEVDGRLERSQTITLTVRADGVVVSPTLVTWRADPPGSADFPADGTARLLESGPLALIAESAGSTGRADITVSTPPQIVFDMRLAGIRDIYVVALDGRDLLRLTVEPTDDMNPTSAAGQVVFTSFRDQNAELYQVPIAGGSVTRLTQTAESERAPAFAPGGGELAFVRDEGGLERIWRSNADLSNDRRAFGDFGPGAAIESAPAWSPDGSRIAFMSTAAGNADVFEVDLASGQVTVVADDVAPDFEPAFDPMGATVVFSSDRSGDLELYAGTAPGVEPVRLTTRAGDDSQPAFLLDGRLMWTARIATGTELRWMEPDDPPDTGVIPLPADAEPQNPAPVLP